MSFVAIVNSDVSLISFSAGLSFVFRRVTDCLELILYPATLLKVFFSGRISLVEILGYLCKMFVIISSANKESSISSFPIYIPLISFVVLMLW